MKPGWSILKAFKTLYTASGSDLPSVSSPEIKDFGWRPQYNIHTSWTLARVSSEAWATQVSDSSPTNTATTESRQLQLRMTERDSRGQEKVLEFYRKDGFYRNISSLASNVCWLHKQLTAKINIAFWLINYNNLFHQILPQNTMTQKLVE